MDPYGNNLIVNNGNYTRVDPEENNGSDYIYALIPPYNNDEISDGGDHDSYALNFKITTNMTI